MKEFPSRLIPANKGDFEQYRYDRNLSYLRRDIFESIIRGDENSYFELDRFAKSRSLKKGEIEKMRVTIMEELRAKGWKCTLSYGDTGLFIYSTEESPPSCY